MEKEQAKKILASRKYVDETLLGQEIPLKVTNVSPFQREDGTRVNIINFAAMTPYHVTQAKEKFLAGEYQEATNYNLSSNARVGVDFTPVKGQIVNVLLEERLNKAGDTKIIVVSSVRALDKVAAKAISFDWEEEVLEGAEAPVAEAEVEVA